ncbi:hypothetical protein NPIL_417141 [Nephila pilipes]|uniref:Uncharacterized protein n=1 Tax=Nephila pilipes TaxID=299642 RepID=A0A8X6MJI3_NEPPI|nr:hypothetical protein NPIL_417141 [Nephila pilipes]
MNVRIHAKNRERAVQHSNIYPQRSWFANMVVASMVSLPVAAEADEHFVPPHLLEVTESVPGIPSRRVRFRMAALNRISASRRILRSCYENFQDLCLDLRLITDVVRNLETITFLNMSPEFGDSSKHYCNKTFYNYTYYSNFVTLCVSFLAMILHYPCCVPFRYFTYLRI